MNTDELKQRKKELEAELTKPEVFQDPQRIKEVSIQLGKIEKELRVTGRGNDTGGGAEKLIMEIRAGAGGKEASLFAAELFRMYTSYAKRCGWNLTIMSSSPSDLGGIKEAVFEVAGENSYRKLKNESGVHRVQRIPETEKSGRIHTSTASVAVLPEAKEEDIEVKPQDTKIEFFRSSGPGGQNVNKVETGVRITHIPTGVVVASQESRSQQQNRERALTVLRTRLLEEKRRKEEEKIARERREQIGGARRVEKIRTYNFPQDRVTDHRIKKSWHDITSIIDGNIDRIIDAFAEGRSQ